MEQPRKFIHTEERVIRELHRYPYRVTKDYLHIGRLEISFAAIGVMVLLVLSLLVIAQAFLAIFGGSWVIAQFAGYALVAILALFLVFVIFSLLRGLWKFFTREITINGPERD